MNTVIDITPLFLREACVGCGHMVFLADAPTHVEADGAYCSTCYRRLNVTEKDTNMVIVAVQLLEGNLGAGVDVDVAAAHLYAALDEAVTDCCGTVGRDIYVDVAYRTSGVAAPPAVSCTGREDSEGFQVLAVRVPEIVKRAVA